MPEARIIRGPSGKPIFGYKQGVGFFTGDTFGESYNKNIFLGSNFQDQLNQLHKDEVARQGGTWILGSQHPLVEKYPLTDADSTLTEELAALGIVDSTIKIYNEKLFTLPVKIKPFAQEPDDSFWGGVWANLNAKPDDDGFGTMLGNAVGWTPLSLFLKGFTIGSGAGGSVGGIDEIAGSNTLTDVGAQNVDNWFGDFSLSPEDLGVDYPTYLETDVITPADYGIYDMGYGDGGNILPPEINNPNVFTDEYGNHDMGYGASGTTLPPNADPEILSTGNPSVFDYAGKVGTSFLSALLRPFTTSTNSAGQRVDAYGRPVNIYGQPIGYISGPNQNPLANNPSTRTSVNPAANTGFTGLLNRLFGRSAGDPNAYYEDGVQGSTLAASDSGNWIFFGVVLFVIGFIVLTVRR